MKSVGPDFWLAACAAYKIHKTLPFIMWIIMPPHLRGGRHSDFGTDLVGICFGVGMTLSCLHSIL